MKASPTVRRRRLATRLMELRRETDLTRAATARLLGWSEGKVRYLETEPSKRPNPRDVTDLLDLYAQHGADISGCAREELIQLAKDSRLYGWWQGYRDVLTENSLEYIGLEAEAAGVFAVHSLMIPSLLQDEDYARAISSYGARELSVDDIERRVQVRMNRQELLARKPEPLRLWAVIGESALHYQVGGREVMRGQLHHLLEVSEIATVTIQVVPYAAGAWPGFGGAFTILQFPRADDHDLVYIEVMFGDAMTEDQEKVKRYHLAYQRCMAVALSPRDSLELVRQAM